MHLIIDGYSSNQKLLEDEDFLRKWFEGYPPTIGMTRISETYVLRYTWHAADDWGISGFVFIAESHIGIHTFVERKYINIDIFSCRDFDAKKAAEDIREAFELVKYRTCLIDREWPKAEPPEGRHQGFIYHE